jgi:hypothetical protein
MIMNKYSVLLLYPAHISDGSEEETYLAHVTADSVASAQVAAQKEAAKINHEDYHQRFTVLLTTSGHIEDLKV